MDGLCECGKKGKLCNWASYDEELCKFNNSKNNALKLCNECCYWRCKICDIRLCRECYKDIQDTDSAYDYLKDICIKCNKKNLYI